MKHVKKVVKCLVRRYDTRNLFVMAQLMGYEIVYCDFRKIGGLYRKILDSKFIFINQNLDMLTKTFICAHELWHGEQHDFEDLKFRKDHTALSSFVEAETEANFFAAELIIHDNFDLEHYFDEESMPNSAIFNKLVEIKRQMSETVLREFKHLLNKNAPAIRLKNYYRGVSG